ncbi:MAG: GNAT family N-acetyltransferase [Gemmatimonadaceae bacterium]|nr:GNAT family N-acetyltransferase [Gemmatimonadaceae bacterium]
MSPLQLRRYTAADASAWNAHVARAKNGTFLHDRRFVEYHRDRFVDASLIVEEDGTIVALLPANVSGDTLVSHAGLTYGGWVIDEAMSVERMVQLFELLSAFLREQGIAQRVRYKCVPTIYHRIPAEEEQYALFRIGARLVRRDVSSAIALGRSPALNGDRSRNVARAAKKGVRVGPSDDWSGFHGMLCDVYGARHGVAPVHSLEELQRLAGLFPTAIRLFEARDSVGSLLAAVLVFDTGEVAHTQYMVSSADGRKCGALDAIIAQLLRHDFASRRFFNFGISTEDDGRVLNAGLAYQKESFGGRAVVHDHYEFDVA